MVSWTYPKSSDTISDVLIQTTKYTLDSTDYCHAINAESTSMTLSGTSTGKQTLASGACAEVIYIANNAKTTDAYTYTVSFNNPNSAVSSLLKHASLLFALAVGVLSF